MTLSENWNAKVGYLWNARCSFTNLAGDVCNRKQGLVIEDDAARCPIHTKAGMLRVKPRTTPMDFESNEDKAIAWWEGVRKRAELGIKEPHVIVVRRKRPWNLCSLCREPTASGRAEKDPADRYCHGHHPERTVIFKAEMRKGLAAKSVCSFNRKKHKPCVRPRIVACSEVCAVSRLAECMQSTTVCFDIERRWRVTRVRCLVRFPKHGPAQGVKPQAARTEHGAPAPSTTPG